MLAKKINNVLLLCTTFLCLVRGQDRICTGEPNGCCPNTKWDPTEGKCQECGDGYFWEQCSRQCPYPTFGKKCLQNCTCRKESCNFISGCIHGYSPEAFINSTDYTTSNISNTSINTTFNNVTSDIMFIKDTSNTTDMSSINSNLKAASNTKFTMLMVGTLAICIVFIAYTTVFIVDKYRKKTLNEYMEQLNQR